LHHFNQTAAISSTTKSLTKAAAAGNKHQPKPSTSIDINESQTKQQTKSSPEMAEEEEEQKQQQNETDKPQHLKLVKSFLSYGPDLKLNITCQQGRSGHNTIKISINSEQKVWHIANIRFFSLTLNLTFFLTNFQLKLPRDICIGVPNIHVPEEAYKFVAAMDRLIGQLPVEAPATKSFKILTCKDNFYLPFLFDILRFKLIYQKIMIILIMVISISYFF
jgi:hypothetical protein